MMKRFMILLFIIVMVMKTNRGNKCNRILVWNRHGNRLLWTLRYIWEGNIKINCKETGY